MINKDGNNHNDWGRIVRTFLMVLIYFVMAFLIIFTNIFNNLFQDHKGLKIGFGVLFFIYGLFRGYRFWRDTRK